MQCSLKHITDDLLCQYKYAQNICKYHKYGYEFSLLLGMSNIAAMLSNRMTLTRSRSMNATSKLTLFVVAVFEDI